MASVLRARWVLVVSVLLVFLAGGAVFAALATPSYRAIATVDDPNQEISGADYLRAEFESTATASHGAWLTNLAVISVNRSGSMVELVADSRSSGAAQDFAQIYADLVAEQSRTVTPLLPATFPTEPRSPNLTRIAALMAVAGLATGVLTALALGRRGSEPKTGDNSGSDTSGLATELKTVPPSMEIPAESVHPVQGTLDPMDLTEQTLAEAAPRILVSSSATRPPRRPQLQPRPGVKPRVVSPRPTPIDDH